MKQTAIIKFGIIPFLLLALWFILTFVQIILNDQSITVLTKSYNKKDLSLITGRPLLKGDKQRFEITAAQNNLGIITIHFNTYDRYNYDTIIFRLKEKGTKKWLYEGSYNARAFTSLPRYPFGFPIIPDSKDKQYIIEIESLHGTLLSSVSVNTESRIVSTSYQFSKEKLSTDLSHLLHFLYIKTTNSLTNHYLLFSSSIFIYPLLFYVIWISVSHRFNHKSILQNPFVILIGIIIVFDCFFIRKSFDLVYIVISSIWGIFLLKSKRGSRESFIVASIILCICMLLQIFQMKEATETAAIWAFFALLVGVVLNFYEFTLQKKYFKKLK